MQLFGIAPELYTKKAAGQSVGHNHYENAALPGFYLQHQKSSAMR